MNSGLSEASSKVSEFSNKTLEALAGVAESLAFKELTEKLLDAWETFEKAGNIFQKTAGATGEALHGLEDSFASLYVKSSASGEALASALAQLSIRTGATGEALEGLTTSFGKLTKVVGGDLNENITTSEKLFKQWGVSVDEQKGKLDELVVVAQKTAIPFQTLAQEMTAFGPILRNMGFDFEQSAALLGKFDLSGIGTQQVMRTLGQGLAELSKNFADPEAALRLLIERMAAAPSTTQALQIAMSEGLGKKGALALADAIHQGAFAIDDLVKSARTSTGTIDDVASRTQTLSGQWTKFQHAIEEAIAPLGKDLEGALTAALTAMKPLAEMLGGLIKWFEDLPTPIKYTVEALVGIVGVTPAVILGIKGITTAWEALGFAEALGGIKNIGFALMNDLVPAITRGETALLRLGQAGVIAATAFAGWELGSWLYKNVPLLRDFGDAIGDFILKIPGLKAGIDSLNGVSGAEADLLKSTDALASRLSQLGIEIERGPDQSIAQYNQAVMAAFQANKSLIASFEGTHPALNQHADDTKKAQVAIEALHAQYAAGKITMEQYRAGLDALTAKLAPSADAMAKAAKEAAEWNDKWAESARRAFDSVADAASGDTSAEQAFSKLNAVIETGSINFDKLSATGVKTLLAVMAAANDMRKALVDIQNNEALDQLTEQLANVQIKASELADKVPLDFKDMMAGVTQGVNFTGLEKQLQTTIDDLKAKLATAGPAFASSLQLVIDKSQGALDGLRSMTAALALIGQDKSMEELAAHIDGLIVEQNKGALSGEQWQAGLNGVSDALLKKIIPAMEQGLPISQALVNELSKIPGIGPQLAAAAGQGFDALNNAVTNWAENTRSSVLTVNRAFADLGVTSLDSASQAMKRSGDDIVAVLKNVTDSTALTSAQFVANQAAVIAWGEKVLAPMVNFGQAVSQDVLNQVAKISPALAQAAKDGPDAFIAALEALRAKASASTLTLQQAFHDLGIKSAQDLNNAADSADAAYQKIAASGTASANVQRDALVKALEAEKAAYIAAGGDLPREQQKQLDKLLAQQDSFNRAHVDQWMKLYKDIQSISDTFFHDLAAVSIKDLLFGGIDNSGLKQQVSDLESQLADTTAAFQKTQQDIAAQMKQAVIDNKASLDSQLADLQSQLDDKTKAYNDYVTNYKQQVLDLEKASAEQTTQQIQALKDTLSQEEQDYAQSKADTIQKMADLTAASKDQLNQQLSDLHDQLASQTESYDRFVQDTTTSIARIGEAFQEAVSDKGTDTGRNIADKQTDLTRAQQDTATEIQRLREQETAANKQSTEQQIADLQTALQRKQEDTQTYIQRAQEDLATYTKEQKEQADQQTADLQEALKQRTDDYTAFVAANKQQQDDDTANAKAALAKQEAALIAAILQKQVQLNIDKAATQAKIEAVTKTNAEELAKQEAALKASLDAQAAAYAKSKADIAAQMVGDIAAAKADLAKKEADLQASLDQQTADYQKYVDGINGYTDKNGVYHKGQLDALKGQFKTVWDDISNLVQGAAEKMLTSMAVSFFKPLTDKIADFIAGGLADLLGMKGLGGVQNAVGITLPGAVGDLEKAFTDLGTKATDAVSQIDTAISGISPTSPGGAAGAGGGGAGGASAAVGAATQGIMSGISSIVGMVTGAISAITGIISIFQNMHQETSLNAIEHNTRYSMMYLGERADGGILGTLFQVHDTLAFGTITKKIEAMSNEFTMHYADTSITKLTEISSNTFWSMKKLDEINSKTGKAPTGSSVNVEGTDLTTVITALDNINTTLQFSVGLSPWFQTAFQNINNGIVACAGWLQGIASSLKSGISTTGGGSTNLAADAFSSLSSYVGSQFSTLYTWLGAALKPLLTQQGGQGLTVAPGLPALPTFNSTTAGSVAAAASGTTVDLTGLETYLSAQFASITAGLASLGGTISTQLTKLSEVTGEILSNSVGLIVATLKTSDQLTAASMERMLKQEAQLSGQSTAALGGIGSALGHLIDITASDFQALIAATKLAVSVPAVNAPLVFAGAGGAAPNIRSSTSNDLHVTITGNTFHGSPASSAKAMGDELIKEMRRRGRSIG